MNILEISKKLARRVNEPVPTSLFLNEDTSNQLLGYLEQAMENIYKAYDWQKCIKKGIINTVDGISEYDLPADFSNMLSYGIYDMTTETRLMTETLSEKGFRQMAKITSDSEQRYTLIGGQVVFTNPISENHILQYYYKSKNYIRHTKEDGSFEYRDYIESDNDEFILDSNLLLLAGILYRSIELQLADKNDRMTDFTTALERAMNEDGALFQGNFNGDTNLGLTMNKIMNNPGGSF